MQETFTTDVLLLNFVSRTKYPTNDQSQMVVRGQTMPVTSHQLDTSELVELLQKSAVEHLTTLRQFEAQKFSSIVEIVTTGFEALYAYKHGDYPRCLRLSTQNVHKCMLIGVEGCVLSLFPEFIQLMDDDIVSLIGLTLIVNPSCRESQCRGSVNLLNLSLYLMTQSQMKLHHPVTSLARTLHYVAEVASRDLYKGFNHDKLLLKLTERKIALYISRE